MRLFILIILFPILSNSQSCTFFEDYSSTTGWSIFDIGTTNLAHTPQRIAINGGKLKFINSPDHYNITRAVKSLNDTLCNNWVSEFIFKPTSIGSGSQSVGHLIFSVTAGNIAPLRTYYPLTITNQDALGVSFVSYTNRLDLRVRPFIRDDTNWLPTPCVITLDGASTINKTYFFRLERINATNAKFSVFNYPAMTLKGTCCFTIPSTIQNLTHIQHANLTGGNLSRVLSGEVDSVCIKNCYSLKSVDLGNDTTLCASSYVLNAGNTGAIYLWSNGTSNQTLTVNSTGTYSVQVTIGGCTYFDTINIILKNSSINLGNDTTICIGDSIFLNAFHSIGASYIWNNGDTNHIITVKSSGIYWVQVTKFGCTNRDTINISVNTFPIVNLGNDTTICNPPILLDAQNIGSTYFWNTSSTTKTINVTNSGTYHVKVSNGNCASYDTINIVIPIINVNLGNDTILCKHQTLNLDAGNPTANYLWKNGSTNQTLIINKSGTYWVTVTEKVCSKSDSINIEYQFIKSIFQGINKVGCSPLQVNFTDNSTVNIGNITSWNWTFGDGNFSSIQNPNHSYTTSGTYNVTLSVTSSNGCMNDSAINSYVIVYPIAKADFGMSPNNKKTGKLVIFKNKSIDATKFKWYFGDGDSAFIKNPKHTYLKEGLYQVTLISTNSFSCSDTIIYNIIIKDEAVIYAPNSFTPNKDGLNDTWKIIGLKNVKSVKIYIFDRWGELIFETIKLNESWDGTYNNLLSQQGIYTWKAVISFEDNIVKNYFGHINLIR